MKVFVTGANGHIGANVVRELIKNNFNPVCYVRPTADLRGLDGLKVEIKKGDLYDLATIEAAMQGCERVIHLAATYGISGKHAEQVFKPSIEGTKTVLQAASNNKIKRVMFCSSVAACGPSSGPEHILDEDDWADGILLPYSLAKTQGEKLAWELSKELNIDLVSLLPATVLGPHDYKPTPSTALLIGYLDKSVILPIGGGSFVDVREIAKAFVTSLNEDIPSGRYLLSGDNVSYAQLRGIVKEISGITPILLPFPRNISLQINKIMVVIENLVGRQVTVENDTAYDFIHRYYFYNNNKAKEILGYQPPPTDEVLKNGIRWIAQAGYLKPKILNKLSEEQKQPYKV